VVLSDATISRALAEGRIEIDPYDPSLLQPSSVDVRVDRLFRVFHNNRYPFIDVKVEQAELTELVEADDGHPFVLHPGEFVLGSTLERVRLSNDLVARLEGKSSLGRLGLLIHSTAGFIATVPYGSAQIGSKYRGQEGPTPSRYYKNFESGE
jgi:dCTP deaminase